MNSDAELSFIIMAGFAVMFVVACGLWILFGWLAFVFGLLQLAIGVIVAGAAASIASPQ